MFEKLKKIFALPNLKDFFAVMREALLLGVIVLLLVKPVWINTILRNAGITSISAMGVNWQERADSAQKIATASHEVASNATQRLDSLYNTLSTYSTALKA